MPKYRKKPVVIEAVQWKPDGRDNLIEIAEFFGDNQQYTVSYNLEVHTLSIYTLEGIMDASPGDYVIRGIKGEYYPCKPDIFDATYEAIEEE